MCFGGADYSSSISAVTSGQTAAINALQQMFGKAEGYLKPFIETGQEAMGTLSDIFLGEGKDLTNIPAFQSLMDTLSNYGIKGLDRSAAAKGLAMSGPQMKGLTNWSQDLALTKSIQPYLSGVSGLYSGGLQGGTSLANLAGGMGNSMANVYTSTGNTLASLYGAQAQSQAQSQDAWVNALMSGLGLAAGASGMGTGLGTGLSSLFGSSSSLFSPSLVGVSNALSPSSFTGMFRARGGPVRKRRMYIVGEEGPEIFVPETDGTILPNEGFSTFRRAANW